MPTMQTEESALIQAILHEPQDDTPRLVLADFLEERGGAGDGDRAEFIRLQCRIAAIEATCDCGRCVRLRGGGQHTNGPCGVDQERIELPDGRSQQAFLRLHERELLRTNAVDWTPYLSPAESLVVEKGVTSVVQYATMPPFSAQMTYRRGFVHAIACPTDAWLTHAGMVCGVQPIGDVRLVDKEPEAMGGSCTEYGWYWAPDRRVPRDPGDLPEELWLILPPPCQPVWDGTEGWKWYRNQQAAREALVLAAVKYGRQRAGLE